jgi:copper(I)-binding protein
VLPRWITHWILVGTIVVAAAAAAAGAVDVTDAWAPVTGQARAEVPLYMVISNRDDAPDSLVRVRCPGDLADYTEKHVTDRGEGGLAMRDVKALEVPAKGRLVLEPGGSHLMMRSREPLTEGQTFTCSVVFKQAGPVAVEVRVSAAGGKTP